MRTKHRRTLSRSGTILPMVLALLALMAGLAANLIHQSSLRHREKLVTLQRARLHASMTDAVIQALQRLADDTDLRVDHPGEDWAKPHEYTTPDGISLWTKTIDQNRFLDLNNIVLQTNPETEESARRHLADFLTYFGDYDSLLRIDALADWIDADDAGTRETPYYAERTPPRTCPNTWLTALSEATQVDGFSHEYFNALRDLPRVVAAQKLTDHLSVIPGARRQPTPVNANTASPILLRALIGLSQDEWVTYLIGLRANAPLSSLDPFFSILEPSQAASWKPFLDVRSSFFLVTVKAYAQASQATLQVQARRDPSTGDVHVLRWVYHP